MRGGKDVRRNTNGIRDGAGGRRPARFVELTHPERDEKSVHTLFETRSVGA